MNYVLATIFVLGVLVFIHELGHFLVAKLAGIRVEKFSLGFGPRMVGKTVGQTEYRISWIPLGGYCKLAGMVDESLDAHALEGHAWEFQSKGAWTRLAVIVAGPAMNFLLALLLLVLVGGIWGQGVPGETTRVGEVVAGRPAAAAGIETGDVITSLDGRAVQLWSELTEYIHARPEQPILVAWRHGEEHRSAEIVPRREALALSSAETRDVGMIGIAPSVDIRVLGPVDAVLFGVDRTLYITVQVFETLRLLITGQGSLRSLGGPIFIGKLAGESADAGLMPLLSFMAFLSINLALLNLLPLPILDGGHVVIIAIEALVRRPLPVKAKMVVLQMGFFLLVALMAFVVYNDVSRILVGTP